MESPWDRRSPVGIANSGRARFLCPVRSRFPGAHAVPSLPRRGSQAPSGLRRVDNHLECCRAASGVRRPLRTGHPDDNDRRSVLRRPLRNSHPAADCADQSGRNAVSCV